MPVNDPLFDDLPSDFREMMGKPIGEWESAPLLPTGYYFGDCVDVVKGNSSKKGTLCYAFICVPSEWANGVGQDSPPPEAKEVLDVAELSGYEFPKRDKVAYGLPAGQIWMTPGAMPMNRDFFTNMGFSEAKPMDECIVGMRGKKVLMGIGRDSYERDGNKREFNIMTSLAKDPR